MDSELKKQLGILLMGTVLGISWYLADLIPTLELPGRSIALIIIVTALLINFGKWLITKYTGAKEEDVPDFTAEEVSTLKILLERVKEAGEIKSDSTESTTS